MDLTLSQLLARIPGIRPDISFQRDDAYRFLPKMIALVMAIVAFMLLLAISLSGSLSNSSNAQRDTLLLHVPAQEKQEHIASEIITALISEPDIKTAKMVGDKELIAQMRPWLGNIEHVEDLPVPTLIRIQLSDTYSEEVFNRIKTNMQAIDASVIVDAPAQWSENYSKFSSMIQWVLLVFSIALLAGLLGLLSFAATTAIKLHKRTVILLHSIGSTDNYIAAQFQINSALLALKGALIGTILAMIIYASVGAYINSMNADLLPDLGPRWQHLWVLFLLPIVAGLVGFASGRLASLHYLKRLM